ncbi:cytotoxic and regulatory T-cell molecule-like isoform X2 [Silurus meridionalis]|nr:cytotoxic and regulatory T-cell molecule-like isoform X2 [Silurus meridionalis]
MKQQIWTFVLFWLISLSTGADVTVTCISTSVPTSVCVLPCTSPYNGVIHWEKDEKIVHSFFKKADQLAYQDADFKDRTSLFQDQIPQGNISLMLRKIRPKDEGRYKCYTATDSDNKEQFVLLKVRVPLKQVDLKKTNEGISCVAKDIYPKPGISWYRDKSPVESFVKTTVDKEGLFSVSSVFPQSVTENTTYICSINTEEEIFTASLRKGKYLIKHLKKPHPTERATSQTPQHPIQGFIPHPISTPSKSSSNTSSQHLLQLLIISSNTQSTQHPIQHLNISNTIKHLIQHLL